MAKTAQLHMVSINGQMYATARDIEDLAADLGPYEVYVFEGDTAGPRHPGTVVVNAIKAIMADAVLRKRNDLRPTDFAKLEHGIYPPNDNVVNYLIQQKVMTKYDMDLGFHSLNIFSEKAARAVCRYLNKDLTIEIPAERITTVRRKFKDCSLSPLYTQKKEDRVKKSLLDL